MRFTGCFPFIKICCNSFCFVVIWLYDLITHNCWIIHNTCRIFSIFSITCRKIPKVIFYTYMKFLHSHQHLSLFHHWFELYFLPSNLHLQTHDVCFAHAFDSFIPVIMLNTRKFNSAVLFRTHTLLDKSLKALRQTRQKFWPKILTP